MATRIAIASGLYSSSATWTGGIIPTTGDDLVSNTFVVTMDTTVSLGSLVNNTSLGGTAGGSFNFSVAGVTVTLTKSTPLVQTTGVTLCTITNATDTVSITTSSIISAQSTSPLLLHNSAGTFNFTASILTTTNNTNFVCLSKTGSGILNLTANVNYQNTSTINLSEDASGLKADFASLYVKVLIFSPLNILLIVNPAD